MNDVKYTRILLNLFLNDSILHFKDLFFVQFSNLKDLSDVGYSRADLRACIREVHMDRLDEVGQELA